MDLQFPNGLDSANARQSPPPPRYSTSLTPANHLQGHHFSFEANPLTPARWQLTFRQHLADIGCPPVINPCSHSAPMKSRVEPRISREKIQFSRRPAQSLLLEPPKASNYRPTSTITNQMPRVSGFATNTHHFKSDSIMVEDGVGAP